jgi:GTP-binding protein Era
VHSDNEFRCGFIAVAGRPNAGKSTLVNHVVGHHVAIVSDRAQTTRRLVRGVKTMPGAQMVFVDLPGSQKPIDRLTGRMQASVEHAITDADAILWVVDLSVEPHKGERAMSNLVFGAKKPVVIAANKIDQMKPAKIAERMLALMEIVGDREYVALVPMSATSGDGIDPLIKELVDVLPKGQPWYGDDDVTDMRDSERVAEYIREAALPFLREELPHASIAEVEEMEWRDDEMLEIHAVIWVENESQVGIVVGKGGERIREIGTAARLVVEQELDCRVHLELRVKTRQRWRDDDAWLARAGL